MKRHAVLRWVIRIIGGLIGLVLFVLLLWAAVAGPETVLRILRYGDTNIDDFSHYPGRRLVASESPLPIKTSLTELQIPANALLQFGQDGDLEQVLAANDSIAFLVIDGDTLVYESYFRGHTQSSLSQVFSMAKSFTSALVGMAIDDGYLTDVEQRLAEFIPELSGRGFDAVTIEHLLTMTSGSDYIENDNPFSEHVILNFTPQLERRLLEVEMQDEPGQVWRYKSGDNALLALILKRALGGETITEYTQRRLWTPLGMEYDGIWTIDHVGDGLEKTWCCLAAAARDFARLGLLYLHNGRWEGKQVVSASWVERSTQAGIVSNEIWDPEYKDTGYRGYGYQWWLLSELDQDYLALGKDGQYLYVNPAQQVIILRLGWSMGNLRTSEWVTLFQTIARNAR
jgi:CubicO group peptidase (beta-lactamase class C family)